MLARLYMCWHWWRRDDLASLLSAATKLVTAHTNDLSKVQHDPGSNSSLAAFLPWLQYWCRKSSTAQPPSTTCLGSTTKTSSSSSSSSSSDNMPSVLPDVDILWLTEELPELSGFERFLAAALGCYDDAKGHLDSLLLQCVVARLAASLAWQKPGEARTL
jgi:hypothetical protein